MARRPHPPGSICGRYVRIPELYNITAFLPKPQDLVKATSTVGKEVVVAAGAAGGASDGNATAAVEQDEKTHHRYPISF